MSKANRLAAGLASYRITADYGKEDQGGHDTDYKNKGQREAAKEAAKRKKQAQSDGQPYQTTDTRWKESRPEGTRAMHSGSSGSWQEPRWSGDCDRYWYEDSEWGHKKW